MAKAVIRILSLGAGIQSTAILLMSCKGDLPKLDCAIFADTGWEPKAVYAHLDWLKDYSESHDIPVHILKGRDIRADALDSQVRGKKSDASRCASMPYRTRNSDGSVGMLRRQCTNEYKIQPIEKFIRSELLGLKPRQHGPKEPVIEQWFGISLDEPTRMRSSHNAWSVFRYPLIFDLSMNRHDCINWLIAEFPERNVPRSACIACPFHSNHEWRWMRDNSPSEFREAVEFDNAIRNSGGLRGQVFIHRDAIPLSEVNLDTPEDRGQINMFENECAGMCGV